ncbi:MAG: extracellular solute-binding protein [Opitutaceae bacterium]
MLPRGFAPFLLAAGLAWLAAAGCRKVENPLPRDIDTASGFLANYKIMGPPERSQQPVEHFRRRNQPETLRVLSYQDLLSNALIQRYREATQVTVEVDFYQGVSDLTQRLQAGAPVDLILLPGYAAQRLIRQQLLAPLNLARIPNAANVDGNFRGLVYDPEGKFTLPLVWSTFGIAYNRRLLNTPPNRWSAMFELNQVSEASTRPERRATRSSALERVQASVQQLRALALAEGPPTLHPPVDLGGKLVPELRFGSYRPVADHRLVDTVSASAGGYATFFTRAGESYVRLSTNVRTSNGSRAIGTVLDPVGPVIAALRRGQPYYGIADILGRTYLTAYEPLRGGDEEIVGIAFFGFPIESATEAKRLQEEAAEIADDAHAADAPELAVAYPDSIHRIFGAALVSLGYGLNETDPAALRATEHYLLRVAEKLKPRLLSHEDLLAELISERVTLSMMLSNEAITAIQRNASIGFISPDETTWIRVESIAVPAALSRERRELAEDFINYLLHPNIAAAVANHALCGSTVPAGRGYLLPIIRFGPLAARLPDSWIVQSDDQDLNFDPVVHAKLKASSGR